MLIGMTGTTVSGVKFVTFDRGVKSSYGDCVHWRRVITADYVENDFQIVFCCNGRLHDSEYSCTYCGVVIDVKRFRNEGRFVQWFCTVAVLCYCNVRTYSRSVLVQLDIQ